MRYSEMTKYPKVFDEVPWGGLSTVNDSTEALQEMAKIFRNRNSLMEKYGLTESCSHLDAVNKIFNKNDHPFLDHLESYRAFFGAIVLIFSVYEAAIIPVDFKRIGFKKVAPLYSLTGASYLAYFESVHAVNNASAFLLFAKQIKKDQSHKPSKITPELFRMLCSKMKRRT